MRGEVVRFFVSVFALLLVLFLITSCASSGKQNEPSGETVSPATVPPAESTLPPVVFPDPDPVTSPPLPSEEKPDPRGASDFGRVEVSRFSAIKGGQGNPAGEALSGTEESPEQAPGMETREVAGNRVLEAQKRVVAERPWDDLEKIKLAMLLLASREYPEAEGLLTGLKDRHRTIVPFLEAFAYQELGEYKAFADRLDKIREKAKRIEGFHIGAATLCTLVSGYRRYVPNGGATVNSGGVALLYVEPVNFTLKKENGNHLLWLEYDWRLYDDRMNEIVVPDWRQATPKDRQDRITFQGEVEEFYQSFRLPLPANLGVGKYLIKITVTDRNQQRSDSQYVSFHVPAMASR